MRPVVTLSATGPGAAGSRLASTRTKPAHLNASAETHAATASSYTSSSACAVAHVERAEAVEQLNSSSVLLAYLPSKADQMCATSIPRASLLVTTAEKILDT